MAPNLSNRSLPPTGALASVVAVERKANND